MTFPRVLIIAGSDSGGGAGIQADTKAVTCNGAYAATAITALTAQNTMGVHAIEAVSPDFVKAQMKAVLEDIGADVIKLGMLHRVEVVHAVADALDAYASKDTKYVLDPVMVATSGDALLDEAAVSAMQERLFPRTTLLTPNIAEAERLTGLDIASEEAMDEAAQRLLSQGPAAILMKGGHMAGDVVVDLLVTPSGAWRYMRPRIHSRHTHGTGCTLASAVAAHLAQGIGLADAVEAGCDYVQEAIRQAPGLGQGHGPLHHGWNVAD